jgi:hypothetical protein
MKRTPLIASVTFFAGLVLGGYLFAQSQPRSFLALGSCGSSCYRPNDLAGLLVSAGIQRAAGLLPSVLKETDKCIAIAHPFPEMPFHAVVFPKKDIKNIGDVSIDDQPYVMDCLGVIRSLILERNLRYYRVSVNGPGFQDVTYLHFHLKSR